MSTALASASAPSAARCTLVAVFPRQFLRLPRRLLPEIDGGSGADGRNRRGNVGCGADGTVLPGRAA
jgi:hypothetical protein